MIMIDADLQIIMYANIIHDVAKSPIDWYDWMYGPLVMQHWLVYSLIVCVDVVCRVAWDKALKMQVNTAVTGRWLLVNNIYTLGGCLQKWMV